MGNGQVPIRLMFQGSFGADTCCASIEHKITTCCRSSGQGPGHGTVLGKLGRRIVMIALINLVFLTSM